MNLRFTPEGVDDLARLGKFIEENNPGAAQRIANDLLPGLEKLKVFPEIGLKVERAFDPERIWDLFVSSYTVRYLIGDGEVVVLGIWHGNGNEKNL